jgi:hypothetical protein
VVSAVRLLAAKLVANNFQMWHQMENNADNFNVSKWVFVLRCVLYINATKLGQISEQREA